LITKMNALTSIFKGPLLALLMFSTYFSLLFSCASKTVVTGKASYYADSFQGKKTANGERYQKGKLTAAHKTLPFGTKVKVTNLKNGRSVKVKINDRGPYAKGRIIDLSKKAAKKIGMIQQGVAEVRVMYREK
jgi:rare lipoprotein A